jgi:GLPGLI family protein
MRSIITIIIVLALCSVACAQKQLQVIYKSKDYENNASEFSRIELTASQFYCFSNTLTDISCTTYGDDVPYIVTYEYIIFKDYKENILYYEEERDEILVYEELKQFSWEVLNETRKILGYQCTKAKTQYRGREYTAWFTTELPFKAAPWKIHGLPGVVLKVDSADEALQMEAIQLKITEGDKKVNPYKKKDCVDYSEFVKIYLKKSKENREWAKAKGAKTGLFGGIIDSPRFEKIEDKDALSLEEAQKMFDEHYNRKK